MAAKSGENWKFSPLKKTLLYYPVDQKFARNRSISYHFEEIFWMLIFRKNPRWSPKVAKIEIFPITIGHTCTTLWVKNSLEIALSLTVFEIFTLFHFPLISKMAAKSGENWKFSPLKKTLLYYPVDQKFARNRSISYHFEEIFWMLIFRKNPRWSPKVAKIEIFPITIGHTCTTLWVKNSLEIALSLTVFEIFTLFHFPQKSKMAAKSGENW